MGLSALKSTDTCQNWSACHSIYITTAKPIWHDVSVINAKNRQNIFHSKFTKSFFSPFLKLPKCEKVWACWCGLECLGCEPFRKWDSLGQPYLWKKLRRGGDAEGTPGRHKIPLSVVKPLLTQVYILHDRKEPRFFFPSKLWKGAWRKQICGALSVHSSWICGPLCLKPALLDLHFCWSMWF